VTKQLGERGAKALEAIAKLDKRMVGTANELFAKRVEEQSERGIPSGFIGLDRLLGVSAGIPRGGITHVVGETQTGKSSYLAYMVAQAQRDGLRCAWVDMEHSMHVQQEFFELVGVDFNELTLVEPLTGELAIEAVRELASAGVWDLIVFDSVGAISSGKNLDRDIGTGLPAIRARIISDMLIQCNPFLSRYQNSLVLINHFTSTMKQDFHGNEVKVPTGGHKLETMPVMRIDLKKVAIKDQKPEDKAMETMVAFETTKSKLGRAARRVEIRFRAGKGFDVLGDLVATAITLGVIEKNGTWLSFQGTKIQGAERVIPFLEADPTLAVALYKATQLAVIAEAEAERLTALKRRETEVGMLDEVFA
jgi:recombination protein RecA